jgi:hypothetical protein
LPFVEKKRKELCARIHTTTKSMGFGLSKDKILCTVDLKQASAFLKTGDILLFAGSGCNSCEIQFATWSIYSHIAIVLKTDHFKKRRRKSKDSDEWIEVDVDPNQLYMLHSINGEIKGVKDLLTGKSRSGVQINSLTKCMSCCIADVHFRQLLLPKKGPYIREQAEREPPMSKSVQRTRDQIRNEDFDLNNKNSKIYRFIKWVQRKPYELVFMDMVDAAVCCMPHPENKKESFFCSELVADFYKFFGILPDNINTSEYIPKDFAIMSDLKLNSEYEETYPYGSAQPSITESGARLGEIKRLVFNL